MLSFMLLATSLFCHAESSLRHTTMRRGDAILHTLYDDHVLWDSRIRTLRECSVLCATDERCSAFTYVKNSSQSTKLCRGYSEDAVLLNQGSFSIVPGAVLFQVSARWSNETEPEQVDGCTQTVTPTSTDNGIPSTSGEDVTSSSVPQTEEMTSHITAENVSVSSSPDSISPAEEETTAVVEPTEPTTQSTMSTTMTLTQTTTVPWLNTPCSSNGDCSQLQSNTECFDNTCVCRPGYFYSVSLGTCNTDCPPENLVTTYTRYPSHFIVFHDDATQYVSSLEECFSRCNSNSNCRSIDFKSSSLKCSTSFTVVKGLILLFPYFGYDHYQRQCM